MMALSCFVMANLPTYEQIGISATVAMIICRMVQGVSSMGEIMGAELYVTEITKPPLSYIAVGYISVFSLIGGIAAIGFGIICTKFLLNWRLAFWAGAGIAFVGIFARTALRETPEFVNAKRRIQKAIEGSGDTNLIKHGKSLKNTNPVFNEKVDWKISVSYFCIIASWPAMFYLVYVYCADLLKFDYNATSEEILTNNFIVTAFNIIVIMVLVHLTKIIHPLKILRIRGVLFLISIPCCTYLLSVASSPTHIFLIQLLLVATGLARTPASPIIYKAFPVIKRFTYASVLYGISRVLVYVITSFGMVVLIKHFGYAGILIIMIPVGVSFYWSVRYFESLESSKENIPA